MLDLPPLMTALACVDPPFDLARQRAIAGVDAGLICWRETDRALQAALVTAPDIALRQAMAALPAGMVALQNALGSLGPSEMAVTFDPDGTILVNGAQAGRFRATAATRDPEAIPDWLVIGWDIALRAPAGYEGGEAPDRTDLAAEGCSIPAAELLSCWARHGMFWLSDLDNRAGRAALAREWQGLCRDPGGGATATIDEDFSLLYHRGGANLLLPLTDLLEE